jgi:hypothetical protein
LSEGGQRSHPHGQFPVQHQKLASTPALPPEAGDRSSTCPTGLAQPDSISCPFSSASRLPIRNPPERYRKIQPHRQPPHRGSTRHSPRHLPDARRSDARAMDGLPMPCGLKTGSNVIRSGQKEWEENSSRGRARLRLGLTFVQLTSRYRETASLLHWKRTAPRRFTSSTHVAGCP